MSGMAPEVLSASRIALPRSDALSSALSQIFPSMVEPIVRIRSDWSSLTRAMSLLLYMYPPTAVTLGKKFATAVFLS